MKNLWKIFISTFLSIIIFSTVKAKYVDSTKALELAKKWMQLIKGKEEKHNKLITHTYNARKVIYIINFQEKGFVLVPADDACKPILAYSVECNFDIEKLPTNAKLIINKYSELIYRIIVESVDNKETVKDWEKILKGKIKRGIQIVQPLCSTIWGQGEPYNIFCPPNTPPHCYTGCVATAMAQIMKRWNYPIQGSGSNTYVHDTYGTLSADFSSTIYDWANMLDSYSTYSTQIQKNAVAQLMYHCGVAVKMNYGLDASGAFSWDVPYALKNFFLYHPGTELKIYDYFTQSSWINMLKNELNYGRPIYYSGVDGMYGHAFVIDGYDIYDNFHVNWGWDGQANGYYTIGNLNPIGYNFNSNNMAVVRIQPFYHNLPVADFYASSTTPAVNEGVDFYDISQGNPTSWYWTFEDGNPSVSTEQNPTGITFSSNGYKLITLTVSNSYGADTKVKEMYINVGGIPSAWIKQNTGFSNNRGIDQIFIVNPYVVWAKAFDADSPTNSIREFTKTINGGLTWTPGNISFTGSTNYEIANIYAFSDTVAFAAMYPLTNNGGVIVKTSDGGNTWNILHNSPDFSISWLNFVHFFNNNDGICMGDPDNTNEFVIYTTSDGGNTWTRIDNNNIPDAMNNEYGIVNHFYSVNNTIWFSTTKGRIYRSNDKGHTWSVHSTGFNTYFSIVFKDTLIGVAYLKSPPYTLKKTTDGGITWTSIVPTGAFVKSPDIAYVPGTTNMWVNVASSPMRGSSYSIDDCSTFINIDTGSVQYTCVTFYDYNTGWAGGFNSNSQSGGIYKWDNLILPENAPKLSEKKINVKVFPNPTKNFIIIESEKEPLNNICLIDLNGKTVVKNDFSGKSKKSVNLSLSNLKKGIYLLIIETNKEIINLKIMIN